MSTSKPPDYEKLFVLDDPLATRLLRLAPAQEWIDGPKAYRLFSGKWQPPEPVVLRATRGGHATDLLWTTFPPLMCVSRRLVELLEGHRFTGWDTYPVEVYDRQGERLSGYFGFAVTGRAGKHDLRRVQVMIKPPPTPEGKPRVALKGLYFENDFWDGSDFCLMGSTSTIIVTERVVKAFKRAKIRNVIFTPLPEEETPASVYEVQGLWPLERHEEE